MDEIQMGPVRGIWQERNDHVISWSKFAVMLILLRIRSNAAKVTVSSVVGWLHEIMTPNSHLTHINCSIMCLFFFLSPKAAGLETGELNKVNS